MVEPITVAVAALTVTLISTIIGLGPLFSPTKAQEKFTTDMESQLRRQDSSKRYLIIKRPHTMSGDYELTETTFKLHSLKSYIFKVYAIDKYASATLRYSGDGGFANWCFTSDNVERNDKTGTLVFKAYPRPPQPPQWQPQPQPAPRPPQPANNKIRFPGNLVFFKSYHNTNLRAYPEGKLDLTTNAQDWEKWYWQHLGGDRFFWQSNFGTYLRANPDGRVDLAQEPQEWETWRKVPMANGRVGWKSHFGTFLSGTPDGRVNLQPHLREWELWIS